MASAACYLAYSEYLRQRFGVAVRKISVNAGFGCPQRNPAAGLSGCIFCNEAAYTGQFATSLSLEAQIQAALQSRRARHPRTRYILYFQNGSNTAAPLPVLRKTYAVIRRFPECVGLSVATRPDCVDADRLALLAEYSATHDVWLELGVQSLHQTTLRRLGRGHSTAQTVHACRLAAQFGVKVAAHLIVGAPGEQRHHVAATARGLAALPVCGVKFHAFHIVRDTAAAALYAAAAVRLWNEHEYVAAVCDALERLAPDCVVMRLVSEADPALLIAPDWMRHKARISAAITAEFTRRGSRQASAYCAPAPGFANQLFSGGDSIGI